MYCCVLKNYFHVLYMFYFNSILIKNGSNGKTQLLKDLLEVLKDMFRILNDLIHLSN